LAKCGGCGWWFRYWIDEAKCGGCGWWFRYWIDELTVDGEDVSDEERGEPGERK